MNLELSVMQLVAMHYNSIVAVNLRTGLQQTLYVNAKCKTVIPIADVLASPECAEKYIHKDDIELVYNYNDYSILRSILQDKGYVKFKFRKKLSEYDYQWIEIEILPAEGCREDDPFIIIYSKDIDADYAKDFARHKQLEEATMQDSLTHLRSRFAFDEFAKQYSGKSVGIAYMDLNRLKEVNDTLGHTAGDEYLKYFAQELRGVFRAEDCYRVGGDEFIIAVPNIPKHRFCRKIERFKTYYNIDATTQHPMAAVGTYWSDSSAQSIYAMTEIAEQFMYQDKREIHKVIDMDKADPGTA